MNIVDFLRTPEMKEILEDAFTLHAATGDTFNVTETYTDGYYNHVTIVDVDDTGKSFAKTVKLSNIGAGCLSTGQLAILVLSILNVLVNEKDIVDEFDLEFYTSLLAQTISNLKNYGAVDVPV